MKRKYGALAILAVALVFGTGGPAAAQQQMQHQSMMQHQQNMGMQNQHNMGMQSRMFQANGMMRTMSEMMQRSEGLSQALDEMMKTQHGQMGEQMRSMMLVTQSLGTMAEQMRTDMEHYNEMLQNGEMMHDHAMQQRMQAFRDNMEGMADQMGNALDNLESMTKTMQKAEAGE